MVRKWLVGIGLAAFAAAAAPAQQAQGDGEIVVTGKKKEIIQALRRMIETTDGNQFARFEKPVCPMAVGLPQDWNQRLTRMIRANVEASGAKAAAADCQVNALVMFVDRPRDLLTRLNAKEPSFFGMAPRAFEKFIAKEQPAYSWHATDTFGSRGQILRQLGSLTWQDPNTGAIMTTQLDPGTKLASDDTGSRLVTSVREEMELSFVAIDSDFGEGKTLRQLADFATLHIMLDIKDEAGAFDGDSILALFEDRSGWVPPMRMSAFDRAALGGLYRQKYNNRSAIQQRENIAAAMRRSASQEGNGK